MINEQKNMNIIKTFKKKGFVFGDQIINQDELHDLRDHLDIEFSNHQSYKGVALEIDQFKDLDLAKKIIKILFSEQTRNIIKKFEEISPTPVSILPPIHVHKNYHNNLIKTLGWHRDCGGELKYKYCKNKIFNKNYLFTKIGIYLQENNEYGGGIDIIKYSHKNFSKLRFFLRKINSVPLKIVSIFHKYFTKLYLKISENFFMIFLQGEKLNPRISSPIFFDSRLIHRGTPVSRNFINNLKFTNKENQLNLPKNKTKYVIYSHFGNSEAVDSYMYDRLKRKNNSGELDIWLSQINFISKIDNKLSQRMNEILRPILEKYKQKIL
tara:strand:- start:107 stop:1078 length:972 start_codon:yes stop_codon:yes gene_type:complete